MTKLIAFSGIGNTGKSTLIRRISQELDEKGLTYKLYGEVAREVAESIGTENMTEFQNTISEAEYKRALEIVEIIKSELYDVIVCDRTWMDNIIYTNYNIIKGKLTGEVKIMIPELQYDKVFLFDTPIKETTTKEFVHYNDEDLSSMFRRHIKHSMKNAVLYSNGMDDGDEVVRDFFELID